MSGVVTTKFRLNNAQTFIDLFTDSEPHNIYFFIANSLAWSNEQSPPDSIDTVFKTEYDVWNSMLAMKRITSGSVSFVGKRNDWTSNERYAKYDDKSTTMYANNYFVLTDDYNVYKCINNNGNAYSTSKPTGTSNSSIITNDGYTWKYMFTIPPAKAISFVTSNFIPVQTLESDDDSNQWDVQSNAVSGTIDAYHLSAAGASYPGHSGTAQAGASSTITLASRCIWH